MKSKSALLAAGSGDIPAPGDIYAPLPRPLAAILVLERSAKIPGGQLDSLECQMGPGILWISSETQVKQSKPNACGVAWNASSRGRLVEVETHITTKKLVFAEDSNLVFLYVVWVSI